MFDFRLALGVGEGHRFFMLGDTWKMMLFWFSAGFRGRGGPRRVRGPIFLLSNRFPCSRIKFHAQESICHAVGYLGGNQKMVVVLIFGKFSGLGRVFGQFSGSGYRRGAVRCKHRF